MDYKKTAATTAVEKGVSDCSAWGCVLGDTDDAVSQQYLELQSLLKVRRQP